MTVRGFWAAMSENGLPVAEFLGPRRGQPQPWDVVESGVTPSFYRYEARLAAQERPGHRCPPGHEECLACGVCRADCACGFDIKGIA